MTWWHYLLLVNIYLVLFFGFYALLLRRETFFQLNRIYLVGAALLSFFIPLIQAQWVKGLFITRQVQSTIYSTTSPDMIVQFAPIKNNPVTVGQLITLLYAAGAVLLAIRLMWQLFEVRKMISKPSKGAYSFFKTVKIQDDIAANAVIARHEEVHARQWHSADVLIIEAVMIINWFNPVVYLYRFAIKHIHEFIADRQALAAGTDKADYALLLLSQTFNSPVHHLVNPFFNHSLLKQRIMMLQKNNSQRIKLAKYGLSAPLFILMLILSSATLSNSKAVIAINNKAVQVFLRPAASVMPEEQASVQSGKFLTEAVNTDGNEGSVEFKAPALVEREIAGSDTVPSKNQVFTAVEHSPSFPGGVKAFGSYLSKTIRYPAEARKNNVQGRVIVTFIVEENGTLSDVKVARGIGSGADEEAVRALKLSPKWIAGTQNGRKVRVQYTVPVQFSLAPSDTSGKTQNNAGPVFGAQFPGGEAALSQFIAANIKYPELARKNKVEGRVLINFVIEKDGSLSNFRVVRGIGSGADEEAIRVIKMSPKWSAGTQNGHTFKSSYVVPINFALATAKNKTGGIPPAKDKEVGYAYKLPDSTYKSGKIKVDNDLKAVNTPLYIVDGKEWDGIKGIDPSNIESMTVLKDRSATDKSATDKYGAKAVNGVVIVTLKKAKVK